MNINEFIRNGGMVNVPNPNYNPKSKKNKGPKFIQVPDDGTRGDSDIMANDIAEAYPNSFVMPWEMTRKYHDYGLSYNRISTNLDRDLVDAQSTLAKFRNSIAQTLIGEIGIGTAKAFADLGGAVADMVSGRMFQSDYDYTNPISAKLGELQEKFNNEVVPIYADEEKNIANGGLLDAGWWAKNIPTVASTLTLLIPSKAVSMTGGAIINGLREANTLRKAAKLKEAVRRGESIADATRLTAASGSAAKELNMLQRLRYDPRLHESLKVGSRITAEALMMRTIENYQEAQQSYTPVYTESLNNLNAMSDEQYAQFIQDNKDEFEGVDTNNKDAVAKAIAHNAANKTFAMDYANTIWDVVQLYGLRNIGKVKKSVNSKTIQQAQRQAILSATKTAAAADGATATQGIFKRYGANVADFLKGSWKTLLSESTEGIEEIVNYIAQQEGLTYGKALFDKTIDPSYKGMYNRFIKDYMYDPAMWESGFWGVLGGVVFAGGGNLINNYNFNRKRKQAEKKRKASLTGGSEEINKGTDDFIELLERPEVAAAKEAILRRNASLQACSDKLRAIDEKKNPFDIDPETGEYKEFSADAGDIETQQALAKMQVMKEYRQKLTLDAINSGTYDLLLDYVRADNVKKAMVEYGLANENNVEDIAEATVRDIEETKRKYYRQLTRVNAAAVEINRQNKNKNAIPYEYVQRVASANTNRELVLDAMDEQIGALRKKIEEESTPETAAAAQEYEELLKYLKLHDLYGRLEADKKRLRNGAVDAEGNPMDAWVVAKQISDINQKQTSILNLIKNSNFNILQNQNPDVARNSIVGALLYTIKYGGAYSYDNATGYGIDTESETYKAADEDIIKQYKQWFEGSNLSKETISHLTDLIDSRSRDFVELDKKFRNENPGLHSVFNQITTLAVQRANVSSEIASTVEEVADVIDTYHNIDNKVRDKLIQDSNKTILSLVGKYFQDTPTGTQDIEEVIIQAYFNNKDEAYRLAKEKLTGTDENGESDADKLISALNIINFSNGANNDVYDYIMYMIGFAKQRYKNGVNPESNGGTNSGTNGGTTGGTTATEDNNKTEFANRLRSVGVTYDAANDTPLSVRIITNSPEENKVLIDTDGNNGTRVTIVRVANTNDTFTILNEHDSLAACVGTKLVNTVTGDITQPNTQFAMSAPLKVKIDERGNMTVVQKAELEVVPTGSVPAIPEIGAGSTPVAPPAASGGTTGGTTGSTTPGTGTGGSATVTPGTASGPASGPATGTGGTSSGTTGGTSTGGSATGSEDGEESQEEIRKSYVATIGYSYIDISRPDNNWDDIRSKMITKIVGAIPEASTDTRDEATRMINEFIAQTKVAVDAIHNAGPSVGSAAIQLSLASRWQDPYTNDFGSFFSDSVENFVKKYAERLIVPKTSDGKYIVRIKDIMYSIHEVIDGTDKALINSIYNVLVSYFASAGRASYAVIDYEDVDNNNILKHIAVANEFDSRNPVKGGVVIPLDLGLIMTDAQIAEFNTLKPGDKLVAEYDSETRNYVYKHNGTVVGYSGVPKFDNGRYLQYNRGWRTDVELDGHGNPVSDCMDLLIDIFTNNRNKWTNVLDIIYRHKAGNLSLRDAVALFAADPEIQKLADESRNEVDNGGLYDNIFYCDVKTKAIPYGNLFTYLLDISSRVVSITSVSQQEYAKAVKENMQEWFKKLHKTYQAIDSIDSANADNFEVTVSDIFEGDNNNVTVAAFEEYDKLNYPDVGLTDENRANCEVAWTTNGVTRTTTNPDSEKEKSHQITKFRGAYVKIYRRDGSPVYVSAIGTKLLDLGGPNREEAKAANPLLFELGENIVAGLNAIVTKGAMVRGNTTAVEQVYNECIDFLMATFAMSEDAGKSIGDAYTRNRGVIPIFRKTQHKGPSIHKNATNNPGAYEGAEITIWPTPNSTPMNIKILKRNKDKGAEFTLGVRYGNSQTTIEGTYAVNEIANFLFQHCSANIDAKGIDLDNGTHTTDRGFIRKDATGKLVLEIPTGSTTYRRDFDSYKDYLVNNRLLKVNIEVKDGSNFSARPTNGAPNASLSVEVPTFDVRNRSRVANGRKIASDYKLVNTDAEAFDRIKALLEERTAKLRNGENVDDITRQLFELVGRGEFYQQVVDICNQLGINVPVFPINLEYDSELNTVETTPDGRQHLYGPVAATNPNDGKGERTYWVRRDGKGTKKRLRKGSTVVGAYWLNLFASKNPENANVGIRTLMHERLHDILHTNFSEEELRNILQNATTIRDTLSNIVESIFENGEIPANFRGDASNPNVIRQLEYVRKVLNNAKVNEDTRLEEFIVEALTSKSFFDIMNSIDYTNTTTNKIENLFTKFMELIRRIFRLGNVRDDSLYSEFINVMQSVNTDTVTTEDAITEESVGEEASESESTEEPEAPATDTTETEDTTEGTEDTDNAEEDGYDEDNDIEIVEAEPDEELEDYPDDTIFSSIADVDNFDSTLDYNEKVITDRNLNVPDDLKRQLPLEQQEQFDELLNSGYITYKCRL